MNMLTNKRLDLVSRRRLLQASAATGAVALLGLDFGGLVFADALTRAERDAMSPDDVIALLKNGNARFRSGHRKQRNLLREQKASAAGQYPMAVVLGCIDSRAPAELILDLGIGDTFNARIAGNVENEDVLGSMEFACALAGAKVVLVMGHTACGAVKGAIDHAELGNLTGLLAKLRPAVDATEYSGERSSKNYGFVDAVAKRNVELTVEHIRDKSKVLRDLESKGSIKIIGSMYGLKAAAVDFYV
jgi:carbonic anhydrase